MVGRKRKSRNRKNHAGSISIVVIVLLLLGTISIKCIELKNKNESLKKQEAVLAGKIEKETVREKEIEELSKYIQTKQYAEQVAKEQLGMVYPDEIIFKEKN